MSIISTFTLTSPSSLFTHKALLILFADLAYVSELRSRLLKHQPWRLTVACLVLGLVILFPTLFAPLHGRVPARLRAIYSTMRSNKEITILSTAMPSPRARLLDDFEDDEEVSANARPSVSRAPGGPEHAAASVPDESTALLGSSGAASHEPSPEVRASLVSRMTFGFVTPAIVKHRRIQFTPEAVPNLPPADRAASVVATFRAGPRGAGARADDDIAELAPGQGDLAWRLVYHFAPLLLRQQVHALISAFAALAPAVGLRFVLSYIAERDAQLAGVPGKATPYHMAILYVVGMALGQMIASVCQSQALFIGRRVCIQLRAILCTEIINKALRRRDTGGGGRNEAEVETDGEPAAASADKDSKEKEARATDGEINNLLSVDVFKVSEIGAYLHFLWPQAPVGIAISVALLLKLLGLSAAVGLGGKFNF